MGGAVPALIATYLPTFFHCSKGEAFACEVETDSPSVVECFAPTDGISRAASQSSALQIISYLEMAIFSLAVFGMPEYLWILQM